MNRRFVVASALFIYLFLSGGAALASFEPCAGDAAEDCWEASFRDELQALVGDDSAAVLGFAPSFEIRNSSAPNALALPGNRIVFTKGLLRFIRSRDELAFIIAHELGHHLLHGAMLNGGLTGGDRSLKTAFHNELEADAFAVRILAANNRSPNAGAQLLRRLASFGDEQGGAWALLNPGISHRVAALED